jgi:hypothetical protein
MHAVGQALSAGSLSEFGRENLLELIHQVLTERDTPK